MKKTVPLLFLILLVAHSYAQPGLVAYYPFSGNTLDSTSNHHDGTIKGGVTLTADRFGNPNSAYHFNGSSGYITCPNDSQLLKSKNISFSVWFTVQNRPGGWDQNVILSNFGYHLSSGGFQAWTSNPPGPYFSSFRNTTHNDLNLQGNDSIQTDLWYNLIVVLQYDSVHDSTTVINYLNGLPDDSGRYAKYIVYDAITSLYIGANRDISCCERYFLGDIDEVKLFARALDPAEIMDIATETRSSPVISNQLSLFPNPSKGSFEIKNLPLITDKINLEVMNLTGQMVFSETVASTEKGKIKAELPNLSSGIYVVRLKTEENIYQLKWVKE